MSGFGYANVDVFDQFVDYTTAMLGKRKHKRHLRKYAYKYRNIALYNRIGHTVNNKGNVFFTYEFVGWGDDNPEIHRACVHFNPTKPMTFMHSEKKWDPDVDRWIGQHKWHVASNDYTTVTSRTIRRDIADFLNGTDPFINPKIERRYTPQQDLYFEGICCRYSDRYRHVSLTGFGAPVTYDIQF